MKKQDRRKKQIENISEIMEDLPKSDVLKVGFELLPILEHWKEIMGEEYYLDTSFSGYRKGILYVKVHNNTTLDRLIYEKDRIMNKIREVIKTELIKDVFFELGDE
ncbi:MAG: DUF721 domain-containing protein [Candidatus Hydrogenedentes bacterium]|nr:DUF721 domain-containing protein [Candidatus Hydrogenedentota bacterium]